MAATRLEHTYEQIDKAIAAVLADVTGPTNPAVAYTDAEGSDTIPLTRGGAPGFISYANFLADVVSEAAVMEGIRDTVAAALVEGSGIDVAVDDEADTITVGIATDATLNGGYF